MLLRSSLMLSGLGALLLTMSLPASAQQLDEATIRAAFAAADANHDGVVDEAEFAADTIKAFHGLDANRDGSLDRNEVTGHQQGQFDQVDKNKDGKLSMAEVRQQRLTDFAKMDKNGDGAISVDEALAFSAGM